MKLAVSNIAWPAAERNAAYALLRECGIAGLEVAPGLLLAAAADPRAPTAAEIAAAKVRIDHAGLQAVSMQSLLFGVEGAALFEGEEPLARLCDAIERAMDLAAALAIPNLVFGSPRQRVIPDSLDHEAAHAHAEAVFRRLGNAAQGRQCRIAIEPNGATYGTNFLNTLDEALAFVERVAHPAVVLNFDIGALHMEGDFDRVEDIAARAAPHIGHVHISEPHLAPAPADAGQAGRVLRALNSAGYRGWCSIEMAAEPQPLAALHDAIVRAQAAMALAGVELAP